MDFGFESLIDMLPVDLVLIIIAADAMLNLFENMRRGKLKSSLSLNGNKKTIKWKTHLPTAPTMVNNHFKKSTMFIIL